MKNKVDFYFLKFPLIFFVIACVLSTLMVFFGLQYEKEKYINFQQGEKALRSSHKKFKKIVSDIDLLDQYTEKYTSYKASGLIGGERRLSWIESLKAVNAVLRLSKLTYKLAPQQRFVRPSLKVNKGIKLNSTPMSLSMHLLHEEDLFALFEGLSLSISNLYTMDSCKMTLKGAVGKQLNTKGANLNAECVLRWISVDTK